MTSANRLRVGDRVELLRPLDGRDVRLVFVIDEVVEVGGQEHAIFGSFRARGRCQTERAEHGFSERGEGRAWRRV